MRITIKTQPYKKMRYASCGDWLERNGSWEILVADLKNWKMNLLVGFHELIEMSLCKDRKISEKEVTRFDIESGLDDPGRSKKAPYHSEHMFAEKLEKQLAKALKINWKKYDAKVSSL